MYIRSVLAVKPSEIFPRIFLQGLHIPFRLSEGMAYHFLFMWLFFLNGIAYVLYTIYFR